MHHNSTSYPCLSLREAAWPLDTAFHFLTSSLQAWPPHMLIMTVRTPQTVPEHQARASTTPAHHSAAPNKEHIEINRKNCHQNSYLQSSHLLPQAGSPSSAPIKRSWTGRLTFLQRADLPTPAAQMLQLARLLASLTPTQAYAAALCVPRTSAHTTLSQTEALNFLRLTLTHWKTVGWLPYIQSTVIQHLP
eukprot:1386849-Rhodomonas_salina.1